MDIRVKGNRYITSSMRNKTPTPMRIGYPVPLSQVDLWGFLEFLPYI
jgi:hypothetical protein